MKPFRIDKIFVRAASLWLLSLCWSSVGAPTPEELLLHNYKTSNLLIIATSNHSSVKPYGYLVKFLKMIGDDPDLKFIVLERPGDNVNLYESLSTEPLRKALSSNPFPSNKSRELSLCTSREWAYFLDEVAPSIRELNEKRGDNPIKLVPIDGIQSTKDLFWPDFNGPIHSKGCQLKLNRGYYSQSGNREQDTLRNVEARILPSLNGRSKAIVIYHYAHVARGTSACVPFMENEALWYSKVAPINWIGLLVEKFPEWSDRLKVILLDEVDERYNPSGVLNVSARARQTKNELGISLDVPLDKQQPESPFRTDSFLAVNYPELKEVRDTPGPFDGIIVLPKSDEGVRKIDWSEAYLREFCR